MNTVHNTPYNPLQFHAKTNNIHDSLQKHSRTIHRSKLPSDYVEINFNSNVSNANLNNVPLTAVSGGAGATLSVASAKASAKSTAPKNTVHNIPHNRLRLDAKTNNIDDSTKKDLKNIHRSRLTNNYIEINLDSNDSKVDLNGVIRKLSDTDNADYKYIHVNNSEAQIKNYTSDTLKCNQQYDKDGNEINTHHIYGKLNEKFESPHMNYCTNVRDTVNNDVYLRPNIIDKKDNYTASCNFRDVQSLENDLNFNISSKDRVKIMHMDVSQPTLIRDLNYKYECFLENSKVDDSIFEKCDNDTQLISQSTEKEMCKDNKITRKFRNNELDIRSNSTSDNIKPNVTCVGVTTSNRNDSDASDNSSNSQESKDELQEQSDYSAHSDSVTSSSNNSLLSKLGYGLNEDMECSETDSSPVTSSDDVMTSLDSGVRTVIYESAGSHNSEFTQNEANSDINKNDNVKATTKSSCILA